MVSSQTHQSLPSPPAADGVTLSCRRMVPLSATALRAMHSYHPMLELWTDFPQWKMLHGKGGFSVLLRLDCIEGTHSLEVEMQSQTHCPKPRNTLASDPGLELSFPTTKLALFHDDSIMSELGFSEWIWGLEHFRLHNLYEREKHVEFQTISSANIINRVGDILYWTFSFLCRPFPLNASSMSS